jgi:threonine synthase
MAAYAAAAGLPAHVFMPADVPRAFRAECTALGATVTLVQGLINDCGARVREGVAEHGWFDVSTLREPYRVEGKKTMGYEVVEQLGWRMPDVMIYPTGGGTGLLGMWKAFDVLQTLGLIGAERPRMVAVQAEGCAPMVKAWQDGEEHAPRWENAHTIASGIRVPRAVGDFLILRAVRESNGFAMAVSDEAITQAVDDAARDDGLLLCPEGGATLAAYRKALAEGLVQPDERAVLFNCATGLKYPMPDKARTLDRNAPIDTASL